MGAKRKTKPTLIHYATEHHVPPICGWGGATAVTDQPALVTCPDCLKGALVHRLRTQGHSGQGTLSPGPKFRRIPRGALAELRLSGQLDRLGQGLQLELAPAQGLGPLGDLGRRQPLSLLPRLDELSRRKHVPPSLGFAERGGE